MEQKELEALTAAITAQVLRRLQDETPAPCEAGKRKVLVIGGLEKVPESVRDGAVLFPVSDYEKNQNILRYDELYVSRLSLTQLSDAAAGRTESPEACALVHALLENIPVSMRESALPHRKYQKNAPLYHLYETYVQTLQIFGVKLKTDRVFSEPVPAKPAKFAQEPLPAPETHGIRNAERVVTEALAKTLCTGEEVHLRKDAIVTPAARDLFDARGIRILKDG